MWDERYDCLFFLKGYVREKNGFVKLIYFLDKLDGYGLYLLYFFVILQIQKFDIKNNCNYLSFNEMDDMEYFVLYVFLKQNYFYMLCIKWEK